MQKMRAQLLLALTGLAGAAWSQNYNFTKPKMAAIVVASQYGNWRLDATTAVPSAGIHTVGLSGRSVLLGDENFPQLVQPNTPLTIDDGAQTEVVTPTAVSCSSSQGPCVFTATFAQAHLGHFTVGSGTDGLQEAINETGPGGGTVVITDDWQGTSAEILAARGRDGVAVLDLRSGAATRYSWNGQGYRATSSTGSDGSLQVRSLNQVQVADQFCTTPGVYDESCINNAVLALDNGGPAFSGGGRIYVPAHAYVIHKPVVLHRHVALEMDSREGAVIEGDGAHSFPNGLLRFCLDPSCSSVPATPGEGDVSLLNVHLRVATAADVGLNATGLTDSVVSNLLVDSTNFAAAGGFGTGMILDGGSNTSDYRNTFIGIALRDLAMGAALGGTGSANANTFLGGSIQGNPALEVFSGSANNFVGTAFNGTNTNGDTLIRLDGGANHNLFVGNYYDDALSAGACSGGPCSATAILIASGAEGNAFQGAHMDPEGGTMLALNDAGSSTDFFALGPISGAPATDNTRVFAGGGGDVLFSAVASDTSRYGFGNGTTRPAQDYGLAFTGGAPLSNGLGISNLAAANTGNAVTTNWYLQNSENARTLYGSLSVTSSAVSGGAESSSIALQCRNGGVLANCLEFDGRRGYLGGTISPLAGLSSALGTASLPFARLCLGSLSGSACTNGTFTAARTIFIPDAASATAENVLPAAHQFLTGFDASTGTFTVTQPQAADLGDGVVSGVGTVSANALVRNSAMPLASTAPIAAMQLAAGACQEIAVTAVGATTSMAAVFSPAGALSSGWGSVSWNGYVSAAGTAELHVCNATTAAIPLGTQKFNLRVIQ